MYFRMVETQKSPEQRQTEETRSRGLKSDSLTECTVRCETAQACSSYILSGLRPEKQENKLHFRWRRKRRALDTYNSNLHFQWCETCTDWEPVCLNYRRTGRYQIQIRFITTYERGLITIWQYQNSCAFFPAYAIMFHFRSVPLEWEKLGHLNHAV